MLNREFWKGKKVFVTGHTGFKGSWLCLWLHSLGAVVTGFSLEPPTNPNLFELCNIKEYTKTVIADIRDRERLCSALMEAEPEIVIHMAAQPLVRESYQNPIGTYETNVLGTVHLLEAVRNAVNKNKRIKAVVNVTTDKCYENKEWVYGYRETDSLGGYDPYSNSKACAELVTSCYQNSFFNPNEYDRHGVALATARAGNVVGGGDWATDRLMADTIRALLKGENIKIRNPKAVRPWQHVLEPLSGYLLLAQKLVERGVAFSGSWNFGPHEDDVITVEKVVQKICEKWGENASFSIEKGNNPHEARVLKLDCSKSKELMNWSPKWNIDQAISKVIEWTKTYKNHENMREICFQHIKEYSQTKTRLS